MMTTKAHILTYILFVASLAASLPAAAQQVSRIEGRRSGDVLTVGFSLDLTEARVRSNQMVAYTPVVSDSAGHVAQLPSVLVAGRRHHYYYLRMGGSPHYPNAMEYQADKTDRVTYAESTAYFDWMDDASITLRLDECGCGGDIMAQKVIASIPVHPRYRLAFETPEVEHRKVRQISGRANVEFIVDKWDIVEDYRGNYAEYAKIRQSIEQVVGDEDARIEGIWLKGFASPESPYRHNEMLARHRVEAIKQYVQRLYGIPSDIIATDFVPEDWEGLRQQVASSHLEHRDQILALIDTAGLDPDDREARIRRAYPDEYRLMLTTWYPALRHTDYRIQYVISNFSDPALCLALARTAPQKLSLNEFYIAAGQCEPGSDEYAEVFETAVRMYPDSEVANLNAANIALDRGDTRAAERYLAKTSDHPKADNARGILAALGGDRAEALRLFRRAEAARLPEAAANRALVERIAASDLPAQ